MGPSHGSELFSRSKKGVGVFIPQFPSITDWGQLLGNPLALLSCSVDKVCIFFCLKEVLRQKVTGACRRRALGGHTGEKWVWRGCGQGTNTSTTDVDYEGKRRMKADWLKNWVESHIFHWDGEETDGGETGLGKQELNVVFWVHKVLNT